MADVEAAKTQVLLTKKQTALTQAGYSAEQLGKLTKLVEGESDEEIAESINELKTLFPTDVYYGDPSANNGAVSKPKEVDAEEVGGTRYHAYCTKLNYKEMFINDLRTDF